MSKVKLMIEMDEETYNLTREHIGYWLSNPRNRRTKYPYRLLSEFYEDKRIEESDDAVSRQAVRNAINNLYGECNAISYTDEIRMLINILPPVLPKCEQGEWIKDDFTGLIKCSRCKNDAPISTVSGTQYESDFCQSCGAEMR